MKSILAAVLTAAIAISVPTAAIDAAARVLTLAIALMATGIFPCMTLTVNAMKGEERSPAMVKDLYQQLRTLLGVLVVAFVLAIAAVLSLVFTTAAIATDAGFWVIKTGVVFSGSAIGLFGARVISIGQAFFALLEINRKHAILVARKRVRHGREQAIGKLREERFESDDNNKDTLEELH